MKEPVHHFRPQLASNRKVILWAHILLGVLAAMVYLSGLDLAGFRYWSMHAGVRVIVLALPALVPYIISAIVATLLVGPQHHIRVWFFLSIVSVGTVSGALLLSGAVKIDVGSLDLSLTAQVSIVQSVCFATSAVLIFWK